MIGNNNASAMQVAVSPKLTPGTVVLLKQGHRRGRRPKERTEPASREAQRFAAVILEVLAGVRTPTDAAVAIGVSVPRYYLWEQRALEGLVAACEPRPVGQGPSQQHQITVLQKELVRLRQNCVRQQALVRASQRAIGLTPPPQPGGKPVSKAAGKSGDRNARKGPRKRRPVVRALKAAAALRAAPSNAETPAAASGLPLPEVLQQSAVTSPSQPAACGADISPATRAATEG
jgi:hypothetical protein